MGADGNAVVVQPVAPRARRALGRVLFVDDDALVRRAAQRAIEYAGFDVEVASNGEEALELLALGAFTAVITDVFMPGMSGAQLAARARALVPTLRVVLASGDLEEDVPLSPGDRFLAKPFTIDALRAALA